MVPTATNLAVIPYQAVIEADHHLLDAIHVVFKVDDTVDLSELLEGLLDDDGGDLAIRDGDNLADDILGIFGRPEVDKPEATSILIEDKGYNTKVRYSVADHLLLE